MQLVLTVLSAILSDHWRNRPALMSVSTFWGFFTAVVLAVWTVPDGLKWFAFEMFRAYVPYGPIGMAWAKYVFSCYTHLLSFAVFFFFESVADFLWK